MGIERKIWLNKPQRIAHLVNAQEHYHIWGRGTGKTEGPIALRSIRNAKLMPRGATGMVGATYMQILTRTLPPLEKAWQRYGLMPDVHYWVGKFPPKELNIPRSIYHPRSPEHSIFMWNGHVRHFMSLDRPGLANGKTVDCIDGDEVRFMNHQRYIDDIAPTNRGNREIFGHLAEHHSITFCTDMPADNGGKWLLDKEKEMDKVKIAQIINLQLAYNDYELEFNNPRTTTPRKKYLMRKLNDYAKVLNDMRKGTVFYSEATSLENIEVLGEEQFRQWKREMKPAIYERAILNKRVIQVDKGFYPLLDLDRHAYDAFDYGFIDMNAPLLRQPGFAQDSRFDADIVKTQPLDIAFDSNGYFNCCTIGQEGVNRNVREYRFLNALFVKDEERLEELLHNVIMYYRHHPTKHINFYYDHTFTGTDATRMFSLADKIVETFRKAGWKVVPIFIGQQPRHDTRYRMWGAVLKEDDRRYVRVRINRTNCAQLLVALQRAAVRQGTKGYEKDKTDEKRIHTVPYEEATHFTDAFDTLYIGKYKSEVGYVEESSGIVL